MEGAPFLAYGPISDARSRSVSVCVSVHSCSGKPLGFLAHPFNLPKYFWPRITFLKFIKSLSFKVKHHKVIDN